MAMGQKKILVVDDESDVTELLQARLEAIGYEVLIAHGGEVGLKKARAEKPDLVLLDVMMPKLNGYQVCRELKKGEDTRQIPVMMLTAKAQESDKFWGEDCGCDDYATKPFDNEDLVARIAALLSRKL